MKTIITIITAVVLTTFAFTDAMKANITDTTDIRVADSVIEAVKNIDIVSLNVLLAEDAPVDTVDEAGNTPLMIAAMIGNPRMTRIILAHDPEINTRNHNGETALMIAARHGVTQIVEQILGNGADTSLQNLDGLTAYDIALRNGHADIVNLLNTESEISFSR